MLNLKLNYYNVKQFDVNEINIITMQGASVKNVNCIFRVAIFSLSYCIRCYMYNHIYRRDRDNFVNLQIIVVVVVVTVVTIVVHVV